MRVVFVLGILDDGVGRGAADQAHLAAEARFERCGGTAGAEVRETLGGRAVSVIVVEPLQLLVLAGLGIVVEALGHLDARLDEELCELCVLLAHTSLLGGILAGLTLCESELGS